MVKLKDFATTKELEGMIKGVTDNIKNDKIE